MINPRGMTMKQWADALILYEPDGWAFGKLLDEDLWRDWAVGFLRASHFAQRIPPDPWHFDDWREWAERAYTMLEGQL